MAAQPLEGMRLSSSSTILRGKAVRLAFLLGTLLAMPVANFSLRFQKCQPLHGEERPDHVLSDTLGLGFRLDPHQAMDRLAWHDGQNPLVRQENIRSRSSPQSGHLMRANPQRGLPQSR